jgi:hypothetical protein
MKVSDSQCLAGRTEAVLKQGRYAAYSPPTKSSNTGTDAVDPAAQGRRFLSAPERATPWRPFWTLS